MDVLRGLVFDPIARCSLWFRCHLSLLYRTSLSKWTRVSPHSFLNLFQLNLKLKWDVFIFSRHQYSLNSLKTSRTNYSRESSLKLMNRMEAQNQVLSTRPSVFHSIASSVQAPPPHYSTNFQPKIHHLYSLLLLHKLESQLSWGKAAPTKSSQRYSRSLVLAGLANQAL
jgi:hypothetical protein